MVSQHADHHPRKKDAVKVTDTSSPTGKPVSSRQIAAAHGWCVSTMDIEKNPAGN
jgi:hypothetical protein